MSESDRLYRQFLRAAARGDRHATEMALVALRAYAERLEAQVSDPVQDLSHAEMEAELRQELHGYGWWPGHGPEPG